jgi:hypothetical protein
VTEPAQISREELDLVIEFLRRLQESFGGISEAHLLELAQAIAAVGPAKRRRLLGALLIATANRGTATKAADSLLLKSTVCPHGFLVGKCPLC